MRNIVKTSVSPRFTSKNPAIIVAIFASVTLDIGLDRWFEIRTKTIVSQSLSIAEAYVLENARSLQGTTISMAYDLSNSRTLYNLDRTGFQDFLTKQAKARARSSGLAATCATCALGKVSFKVWRGASSPA